MIDILGLLIVSAPVASGNAVALIVAAIWLGIGIYCVNESRSRGFWADFLFMFGAPLHWLVER